MLILGALEVQGWLLRADLRKCKAKQPGQGPPLLVRHSDSVHKYSYSKGWLSKLLFLFGSLL